MPELLTCRARIDISIPAAWGATLRGVLIAIVVIVLVALGIDIVP